MPYSFHKPRKYLLVLMVVDIVLFPVDEEALHGIYENDHQLSLCA